MDLLQSILNSMDTPPAASEKKKEEVKKQKENAEKMMNKHREELNHFRRYAEERILRFLNNDDRRYLQFQPLDRPYRTIIHEIAETNKLMSMAFGEDGVDRYIVVYKREFFPPHEDEVAARKDGMPWNEETAKEYARKREELQARLAAEKNATTEVEVVPHSNYKDKYVHLIGQESALEAARRTEMNKSYGNVPSENKRDQRSIEQTLADIHAKKKLKIQHEAEQAQQSSST